MIYWQIVNIKAKTTFKDVYEIVKEPVKKSYTEKLKKNFHATKEEITGLKTKSILRFNTSSKRGKDSKEQDVLYLMKSMSM